MPEINLSMAGLDLAMEIKGVENTNLPSGTDRASPPHDGKSESFKNVLAHVEEKSQRSSDAGKPERDPHPPTDSPDMSAGDSKDVPGDKPVENQDDLSAAGTAVEQPSEVSQPVDTGGSPAGNPTESILQSYLKSISVQTGQPLPGISVLEPGSGEVTGPVLPGQAIATGSILIADKSTIDLGGVITVVDEPVAMIGKTPEELPVSGNSRQISDPPDLHLPGLPERAVEPSGVTGSTGSEVRMDLMNLIESTAPSPKVSPAPMSEWTDVLEINRLLNPSSGNSPALRPETKELPVRRAPVQPEVRETPRNPVQPRFNAQVSERAANPDLWFYGAKDEALAQQAIIRTGAFLYEVQRPAMEISMEVSPMGNGVTPDPVVQQGRVAAPPQATINHFRIDPELLVTDVREAVMRIASNGSSHARIVLHPPELGELIVRLESAKNGVVRAEFHTISPLVREALEAGISRLTEALEAEGLTLAQADVYLDLQLGAEDGSGEQDAGLSGNGQSDIDPDDGSITDGTDGSIPVVERLPEGSTISLLA